MSSLHSISQEATEELLLRVTSVCAECYDTIKVGDIIHYDMQNYRYLCLKCEESLSSLEPYENKEEGAILF